MAEVTSLVLRYLAPLKYRVLQNSDVLSLYFLLHKKPFQTHPEQQSFIITHTKLCSEHAAISTIISA